MPCGRGAMRVLATGPGPKAWNKFSRGGRDAAGMSWAREIYEELCREETHAALEELVWYECEEWPRGELDWEDFEAKKAQEDTQGSGEGFATRGGRYEEERAADVISLGQSTTKWTRGELVGPVATGISSEASTSVAAADEGCFLCGEWDCDCEAGMDWAEVWFLVIAMCEMATRARQQQKLVTTIRVGLRGLAKTREVQRSRRKHKQAEEQKRKAARKEKAERWIRRWWSEVSWDYEQKTANRVLVRVAMQTALRKQTAVHLASEVRQMEVREAAFRRLVVAEHKAKGSGNRKQKQQGQKQKQQQEVEAEGEGRKKKQAAEGGSFNEGKGSNHKKEVASELTEKRYLKKAEVIRLREPKIPW